MATYDEDLESDFSLTHAAQASVVWGESISSDMSLGDDVDLVWLETVTSDMSLSGDAVVAWDEGVSSDLGLTESGTETLAAGISTPFSLTEAADDNAVYNEALSTPFSLQGSVAAWLVKPGGKLDACDDAYLTTAPLSRSATVTFSSDGEDDVVLRAPEFGNVITQSTFTIVRKTRGGQSSIVRGAAWPQVKVQKLKFMALSEADKDAIVAFLKATHGKEVTYLDHESTEWVGVILNSAIDVLDSVQPCGWEVAIDFQGARS